MKFMRFPLERIYPLAIRLQRAVKRVDMFKNGFSRKIRFEHLKLGSCTVVTVGVRFEA
jgi:hypothetical protein